MVSSKGFPRGVSGGDRRGHMAILTGFTTAVSGGNIWQFVKGSLERCQEGTYGKFKWVPQGSVRKGLEGTNDNSKGVP